MSTSSISSSSTRVMGSKVQRHGCRQAQGQDTTKKMKNNVRRQQQQPVAALLHLPQLTPLLLLLSCCLLPAYTSSLSRVLAAVAPAAAPLAPGGVGSPSPGSGAGVAQVRTEAELVQAFYSGRPILVMNSIFLSDSLPPVNTTVSISGDPVACRAEKHAYCRVDCKRACRQFTVETGGTLTLSNLMVARGLAPGSWSSGGAVLVRNQGTVIANTVIFRYNGAPGATAGGGAIEVETGGTLLVKSSLFLRNYAGFGGAVAGAKGANIHITGSFFNRNVAVTAGGAVSLILNSIAVLSFNDYHGNSAAIGGAVQLDNSTATFCNTWTHTNNATLVGPQVFAANNATVYACKVDADFIVVASGATLTQNCTACT